MKVLKKIIIFILMGIVFVMPINLFMVYRYSKVVLHSNEYCLKKVKIDAIEAVEFSGQDNSRIWSIFYFIDDKQRSVSVARGSESYNHFISAGQKDEVFGGHLMPEVNESIWIWYNPKTIDFYALGEEDTFKTKKYWLKTIFHLLLVLTAIWSIRYQIRYNKKQKNKN
jgi:hypothetical protein